MKDEYFLKGTKKWAAQIRQEVKSLARTLDTGYVRLGQLLYEVWDTHINNDPSSPLVYTLWGYGSFHEYASNELDLNRRKAEMLRRIYYVLHVELDLTPQLRERLEAIGYSRLREVVGILTSENAEGWAKIGEQASYAEFEELVSAYRKKLREAAAKAESTGSDMEPVQVPEVEGFVWERFKLFDEQHEVVKEALRTAGVLANSDKKSHLLTLICMDFLATNGAMPPGSNAFIQYVANLERVMQIRFVAINPKTNPADPHELVYGYNHLMDLFKSMGIEIGGDDDDEEEVA